jgi:hypothetical protein
MRRLVLAVAMIAAIGGSIAAYNALTASPAAACLGGSNC